MDDQTSEKTPPSLVVEAKKGSAMIQDLIMLGVVRLPDAKADMNLWVFNYWGPRWFAETLRRM